MAKKKSDDWTGVGVIEQTSWDSIAVVRLSSLGIATVDIRLETPRTGTDVGAGAGEVEVYT